LTQNPSQLQLTPFLEAGTGWNNLLLDPDPSTLVGIGLGLRWAITPALNLRLDYGVPLIAKPNKGTSLQDNGFYFSLSYQPF
jgi:hemolysin activation/secretion protein